MFSRWLAAAAILAVLPTTLPATAQMPPPMQTSSQPGPDDRAKQWLALLDDSNYADGAAQLGPRTKMSADNLRAMREPLGAMASRTLKDVKLSKTLPGMPSGQYAVVRFETGFAHKPQTVETVALSMNKNAWSVTSYTVE